MDKMDISIIIVSWKVRDLLKKCLESIDAARGDLGLEIFVVDNASGDGTVDMVKRDFPNVMLIESGENLGFARANNLALKQARGEYVLILNPDTEISDGALNKMLEFMKHHPECGALGPQLFYPDGKSQPSVRRFPTFWPILLMLLKLPKLFPNLRAVSHYLARDFDYNQSQKVDQIMGACMFLPRQALLQAGFFDERFFIWFEEVDLCRRLKDAGYEVWYDAGISVMHHGGKSFSQQAAVTNQWRFFTSALKYFLKYPGRFWSVLTNSWLLIGLGFVALEALSFLVFPSIAWSRVIFALLVILAGILTTYKTEIGAYLLLAELVVGGFGYLVSFPLANSRLSLRLGLFVAVFAVWLVKFLWQRKSKALKDWRLIPLAIFFIIFCVAVVEGYLAGHSLSAVFADLNGYLYFGLIGLFLTVRLKPMRLAQILFLGTLILGVKTLLALFLFSHGLAAVNHSFFYTWIRDTGVGEISLINWPLFRIFFQSHFYNLLSLIFCAFLLLVRPSEAGSMNAIVDSIGRSRWAKILLWLVAWFNFFILVVSQSRSFWVAGLVSFIIIIPALAFFYGIAWKRVAIFIILVPAFAIVANFCGQLIIGDFQVNLFTGRVSNASNQAGISSRLAELAPAFALIKSAPLLGHGFGTTIHFRSDDPRIKNQSNPEGWTDAAAIEWGYLDLAIKAGLLGLAAYLAFLFALLWTLWQKMREKKLLAAGLLAGLIALMIVHMFTPYLNHPLGIGYLLAVLALVKKPA